VDVASIQYQLGYADRLSQYTFDVACNFLKTLETTMAREKDNIQLPAWMVQAVLAESQAWVGQELLERGRKREAAKYLWQSLHHRKWQPAIFLHWLRCHLPGTIDQALLGLCRRIKRLTGERRGVNAT
jgi:hypothetical protein